MSRAKQTLLANDNSTMLKQRHMQTDTTRAFTQVQALQIKTWYNEKILRERIIADFTDQLGIKFSS